MSCKLDFFYVSLKDTGYEERKIWDKGRGRRSGLISWTVGLDQTQEHETGIGSAIESDGVGMGPDFSSFSRRL